ncbi:MAG: hypothetical protein QM791_07420 [Ferruginibacter sp.]
MAAKNKKLYISLPKPCGEDWEQMEHRSNGRFCTNCKKTVVDFTQMTDKELFNYFSSTTSIPCGRFHTSQLNRQIIAPVAKYCLPVYFKNIAAAVATLVTLKAYSGKPVTNHPIIEMVQSCSTAARIVPAEKDTIISGSIKDWTGRPLTNAKINSAVIGDIYTDTSGNFSVRLNEGRTIPQTITFSFENLVPVIRNYHPAMDNAVYDIVLYERKKLASCFLKNEMGGAPVISFIDDFPTVSFAKNTATLAAKEKDKLNVLAGKMKENPFVNIIVTAYPAGTTLQQQKLAIKRREAVVNYMVLHLGISRSRLITDKIISGGKPGTIDFRNE